MSSPSNYNKIITTHDEQQPQPCSIQMTHHDNIQPSSSIPSPKPLSRPSLIGRRPAKLSRQTSPPNHDHTSIIPPIISLPPSSRWTLPSSSSMKDDDDDDDVVMGHLPPVPLYYPLQKTHVTIRNATVEDVTGRIMESLRCLSVSAVYDSERMTAKAETSNNVKFEIRLFSTTGETTTASAAAVPGILVEVTRMAGCALSFQRCYRSIVRSVTFDQQPRQTTSTRRKQQLTMPSSSSKRTKINHGDDANSNNETATATLSQALETSLSLLLKDRIDANRLGIESLRLLTDVTSTRLAHCVAALLLYDDDDDGEERTTILPTVVTQSLRLTVTSLITNGGRLQRRRGGVVRHERRMRTYGDNSDDEEEEADVASKEESDDDVTDDDYPSHLEDDFDRRHYDTMTNHALGIFANSLSHHSKNNNNDDHYRPLASCWTDDLMIDTLLRKIQSCPTKPHDAQLSLQCLAILEWDRVGKKVLEARRGVLGDATRLSRAVGMCGHELLERESELMMMGWVLNEKGGGGGGGDAVGR